MTGGLGVGVLSFELGNFATNSSAWAIAISVACQAIFAYFIARPKLVTAQSTAQVAERQQAMTEWATLLKQNNENHAEQIKACREENKELSRKVTLIRVSKHNAMDAYGASCLHIQLLESILKDNKLTVPAFNPRTFKQISGDEDNGMLEMVKNGK